VLGETSCLNLRINKGEEASKQFFSTKRVLPHASSRPKHYKKTERRKKKEKRNAILATQEKRDRRPHRESRLKAGKGKASATSPNAIHRGNRPKGKLQERPVLQKAAAKGRWINVRTGGKKKPRKRNQQSKDSVLRSTGTSREHSDEGGPGHYRTKSRKNGRNS